MNESCLLWTTWIDSSSCQFDPVTGNGFRYRTRCCKNENSLNNLDTCNDDQDVMECSPKECENIQCNCDLKSQSFGFKNGNCSSKTLKEICNVIVRLSINDRWSQVQPVQPIIRHLVGENLGAIVNPECGCVEEDCKSECTGNCVLYSCNYHYIIKLDFLTLYFIILPLWSTISVLTEWTSWTACRILDSRSCNGPGIRRQERRCMYGCDDISETNLTISEDCEVTEDCFQMIKFNRIIGQ